MKFKIEKEVGRGLDWGYLMIENEMMRVDELKLKVCSFIVVTFGVQECTAIPIPHCVTYY